MVFRFLSSLKVRFFQKNSQIFYGGNRFDFAISKKKNKIVPLFQNHIYVSQILTTMTSNTVTFYSSCKIPPKRAKIPIVSKLIFGNKKLNSISIKSFFLKSNAYCLQIRQAKPRRKTKFFHSQYGFFSSETVSFLRPFARLALKIARPPFVAILALNPNRRLRFTLLG